MHRLTSVISQDPRVMKFMRLPDAQLSAILEAHDFYVEPVPPEIPVPSQTLIDSLTDESTPKPVVPPVGPPKPDMARGVYWKHPKTGKLNGPFSTPDEAVEAAKLAKVTKPALIENP